MGKLNLQDPQNLHSSTVFLSCDGESINNGEMGRTYRTHVEMKKS
jgi:hypothetical protein